MDRLGIQFLSTKKPLEPSSIKSEWIIAGEPKVRSTVLSTSADELSFVVVWECTAGKFQWHYHFDETIHFLEGSVTIDDRRGSPRTLNAGDVVFFPKGSSAVWTVHTYIRKLAICRRVLPPPIAGPIKLLRALKAALRGSKEGVPLGGSAAVADTAAQ